jgi:hypothetical protein
MLLSISIQKFPIPHVITHTKSQRIEHRARSRYTLTMSFSFGFSGDDIEEDPNDVITQTQQEQGQAMDVDAPAPIPARTHDLDEMVRLLSQSPHFQNHLNLSKTNYHIRCSSHHNHVSNPPPSSPPSPQKSVTLPSTSQAPSTNPPVFPAENSSTSASNSWPKTTRQIPIP